MCNFITMIFLTAQVTIVLGIITKGDLPRDMQNCLDNTLIPALRARASDDLFEDRCNLPNYEDVECRVLAGDDLNTRHENVKCLNKIFKLPQIERLFTAMYLINEHIKILKYDFSSELPENMRYCMDTMKPIWRGYLQSVQDCELFKLFDPSIKNHHSYTPYKECLDKIESPHNVKCWEIEQTLTDRQMLFAKPYDFKVIFDL